METTIVSETRRVVAKPALAGKWDRCVAPGKVYTVGLAHLPPR